MDRIKFISCISAAVIGCSLGGGCGRSTTPAPELRTLEWRDDGLVAEFDRPAPLKRIVIRAESGSLLLDLPEVGGRARYHASMVGVPGDTVTVELHLSESHQDDHTIRRTIDAPPPTPPLRALIALPAGQPPMVVGQSEGVNVAVPAGATVDMSVVVENTRQRRSGYELSLRLPNGVTVATPVEGVSTEDDVVRLSGVLVHQFDFDQVIVPLSVPTDADTRAIVCELTQSVAGEEAAAIVESVRLLLSPTDPGSLAASLRVEDVDFPTDARGHRRGEQLTDTVVLPSGVWDWVRRHLRPTSMLVNPYAPYAHQTVRLANDGDVALDLVVEADVRAARADSGDADNETTASDAAASEDFAPGQWLGERSTAAIRQLVHLRAGESVAATLPFYVRPDVAAGTYRRRFRVLMVGAEQPITEFDRGITVRRGSSFVSATVAVCALLALVVWLWWFVRGRALTRRIGVDALAVIAVFATTQFAVSFICRIGGDVLAAVMGPFSMFVASLGSEALTSLLLAAVVVIRPLPGVALMTNTTVFLLNALFSGQFGVADLWFVTISIGCCELGLWSLGVTRGRAVTSPRSLALRVGVAIGLANAATLLGQFCIVQVLYRLFFADWYVAAVVVITGLGYGLVGATLGATLGTRLRRVTL